MTDFRKRVGRAVGVIMDINRFKRAALDGTARAAPVVVSDVVVSDIDMQVFLIIFRTDLDFLSLQIPAIASGANDKDFGGFRISGLHFNLAVDPDDKDIGVVGVNSKVFDAYDVDFHPWSE